MPSFATERWNHDGASMAAGVVASHVNLKFTT
jgi:hypothetical protein